jgi:hypothetical protein
MINFIKYLISKPTKLLYCLFVLAVAVTCIVVIATSSEIFGYQKVLFISFVSIILGVALYHPYTEYKKW